MAYSSKENMLIIWNLIIPFYNFSFIKNCRKNNSRLFDLLLMIEYRYIFILLIVNQLYIQLIHTNCKLLTARNIGIATQCRWYPKI